MFAQVESGSLASIEFLLQNYADVNMPESNGMTALHVAARTEGVQVVCLLLEVAQQYTEGTTCSSDDPWGICL